MTGLEFVKFIQEFRNPFLDYFFRFLNYFDTLWFFILLVPIVCLWSGWKIGLRIFYILVLSHFAIHSLKEFFSTPRPYNIDPTVGLILTSGGGHGFPSGGATTCALLAGILISTWKSSWRWVIAFVYVALISLSRIYLGMHFLGDVLGGWVLAFILWLVYAYFFPVLERKLEKMKPIALLALSQAIPLLLLVFRHTASAIAMCLIGMAFGIGLFLRKYN